MILGGLALAFSRLIDNSVVVLENIFRHLEMGESPEVAAERGGKEVALPVLAATLTTVVVFFPVTFLYGVSRFLFTALALSVVLSLFASYFVAMTVVPLFCAKLIKGHAADTEWHGYRRRTPLTAGWGQRFNAWFNRKFHRHARPLRRHCSSVALLRPLATVLGITGIFVLSLALYPLIGKAYFPAHRSRPIRHQSQGADRHAAGTHRRTGRPGRTHRARGGAAQDLKIIVSNIGTTPGFSSIYTPTPARTPPCAGGAQGRPHAQQLRIHGPGARAAGTRTAAAQRLFPDRRPGGCRAQPGHARALDIQVSGMRPAGRPRHRRAQIAQQVARACPASATCWCRRTWITRR